MEKLIQITKIAFLVSVFSVIWFTLALPDDIPVPEYEISEQSDLPDDLQPLLGRWEGQWNPGPKWILLIEKVSPGDNKVQMVICWSAWKDLKPGNMRREAELGTTFFGKHPQIKFKTDVKWEFVLKDEKLKGTRDSGSGLSRVSLTKAGTD